jgi:pimeloyl-[acyl-carrier protein] methyl ester esterase
MKPLLLLHGWGFDSQIWQPLLPWLTHDYEIFFVDLPGFGKSNLMDWQTFKASVLSQLPQQFAVLGWSLGGLYATRLAIEAPDRITDLINVASSPCFTQKLPWRGIEVVMLEQFSQQVRQDPKNVLAHFLKLQGITTPIACRQPTTEGLLDGLHVLKNWDLREQLNQLSCTVSYFFGKQDAIVPYKIMQTLQHTYPHFDYELFPKSAHALFLSHPGDFIEKLKIICNSD